GPRVVGGQAFDLRHLAQRAGLARRGLEQGTRRRRRHRPEIGPAGPAEGREGADRRERFELGALESRAPGQGMDLVETARGARRARSWTAPNGPAPAPATRARAALSRSPRTYRNPSRTASLVSSGSITHSHSERVTSMGRIRRPWRCASFTMVAG